MYMTSQKYMYTTVIATWLLATEKDIISIPCQLSDDNTYSTASPRSFISAHSSGEICFAYLKKNPSTQNKKVKNVPKVMKPIQWQVKIG